MNTMPGSPFFHACFTIVSKTARALSLLTTTFVLGLSSSYSPSFSRASMNLFVTPTDMLKLLSFWLTSLQVMKSRISGWSTLSIPIFAPLLVPPCFTASVAVSKTVIKDIGPEDIPFVEPTTSPLGLNLEKPKPVPPPDLCIIAAYLTASNMDSIESSTGSTKHAESCPSRLPAFINVGLFGRNEREVISL